MPHKTKGSSPATPATDYDYQVRNDADTLLRAGEIIADKHRLAAAKKYHEEQMAGMDKLLDGLRRKA